MTDIISLFQFYAGRFNLEPRYHSELSAFDKQRVCVVIPAREEEVASCLASLGECAVNSSLVSVLLVFNNELGSELTELHHKQKAEWHGERLANGVLVEAIAATDLAPKHAGVGLARKIGMDAALALFAQRNYDGLMACLDADCTVESNYLQSLLDAESSGISGFSVYFEHPLTELGGHDKEHIINYEIWLRYYIQGLRFAGYAYAYHTVGSCMGSRASVYAQIGGMNRRKAGEDFYFLHKLIPQGGFVNLNSTVVYPSARDSDRVPFGTGRAMMDMRVKRKDFSQVYSAEIFNELRKLLQMGLNGILEANNQNNAVLKKAVTALGWQGLLEDLAKRSPTHKSKENNFQRWLDGFRVLKLVHWLRDEIYGVEENKEACYKLLNIKYKDKLSLIMTLRKKDRDEGVVL